ncbi:hypothetical protein INT48_000453 [Thamnidium elegans]|uniref:ER membrane protein complex subunit 10 n=1 Tax=Thamnidium elegans TaxID=101142 RepID=A0A8H7SQU3_9FUNG|nr:hypothetical protein INT48_000453 [Thamnidium elegans]
MSRSSITLLLLSLLALACQVTLAQVETPSTTLTVFHQKNGDYIKRGEIIGLPGVPEYIPASNEIVEFSSKDDFYQIKCQMVASDWHDEFILNLDEDNQFYYFSYYPESNYCQENTEYPVTTKAFNTTVIVVTPVTAPKPLIGNFGSQKKALPKSKTASSVNDQVPDEKEIEEKTFFQKYWYLILGGGFLLMNLIAAPEPPATAAAPSAAAARR